MRHFSGSNSDTLIYSLPGIFLIHYLAEDYRYHGSI